MISPSISQRFGLPILKHVLLSCLLISTVCLIIPHNADAWSSVRENPGLGSHITLSRMAYDLLKADPAFHGIIFPSINDIITEGTVTGGSAGGGPGPDNAASSPYSAHYYNPDIKAGGAPTAADDAFKKLKKDLFYAPRLGIQASTAKAASWLAHFVQDMTVPYHVLGMPGNYTLHQKNLHSIIGPRTPALPVNKLLERYRSDRASTGKNADWFEAWYYDGYATSGGTGPTVKTSTHFKYEFDAMSFARFAAPKTAYSTFWSNAQPVGQFTRLIATNTHQRMEHSSDIFNAMSATTVNLLSSSVIHTYTAWRASFSGLRTAVSSIKPITGKTGFYTVAINFENLSKETASQITSEIIIEDNAKHQRKVIGPSLRSLGPTKSSVMQPPVELSLSPNDVFISVIVRGRFQKTPDAGEFLFNAKINKYITIRAEDLCRQFETQITQACHAKDINQVNVLLSRANAAGCKIPSSAYKNCSTPQPSSGQSWLVWHSCDSKGGFWCRLKVEFTTEKNLEQRLKKKPTVLRGHATKVEAIRMTCRNDIKMDKIWRGGQFAAGAYLANVRSGVFCVDDFVKSTGGKFVCRE